MRNRLSVLKAEYEVEHKVKLKQKELADMMGVSRETVSRMMRNLPTRIDSNTIMKICTFFRCQPSALLFIEYEEEGEQK